MVSYDSIERYEAPWLLLGLTATGHAPASWLLSLLFVVWWHLYFTELCWHPTQVSVGIQYGLSQLFTHVLPAGDVEAENPEKCWDKLGGKAWKVLHKGFVSGGRTVLGCVFGTSFHKTQSTHEKCTSEPTTAANSCLLPRGPITQLFLTFHSWPVLAGWCWPPPKQDRVIESNWKCIKYRTPSTILSYTMYNK